MKRRQFLRQSASSVAATTVATAATTGALGFPAILRGASPNSKLRVASIGVGGMGGVTLKGVASHPGVEIAALCDVDATELSKAARSFPGVVTRADWRELLAGDADKFDAVTIGIPDHMHAAPAVTAIRAGKHVYLQKPMASTLHECRTIAREAAKAGVVTQLGNQGRSSQESRQAVEMIRSGLIGKIKEVILWENKKLNWWPKNTELRAPGDAVPEGFSWDLWLGTREARPYLDATYQPKAWRAWFDFGVGEMGDMGCHHFDTSFDALKLTAPLRVRQDGDGSSGPLWGTRRRVEMIFPGSDITAGDTVKLTWHDGDARPAEGLISLPKAVETLPESGTFWIGEAGAIFKNYRGGSPVLLPEENFPAAKYPPKPAPRNHYHDWVDAILEGRKACGDFHHGGPLSETVLVGALADRFAGEWLEWDRESMAFTNSAVASGLVRREYRDGWEIEGL
ncbi:MAG: Gfo/Idh/MocA family oxidoreductase [Verrucomicrobiae bacterium]|nr:Gfo/Idh/MocA family oxidoreductase [Verrucomicrobiae bacterium]